MANICMPLAADFEDSEFAIPKQRLEEAGHRITVIGKQAGSTVSGKQGEQKTIIDRAASDVDPGEFDALVIPGGYSPDHLRTDSDVVDFVRRFARSNRLIAAVCHGPQLLIEADAVKGRTLTSWPSVKKDLQNAGASWVDKRVCVDENLITSRKPDDLEAFSQAIVERLETAQPRQARA